MVLLNCSRIIGCSISRSEGTWCTGERMQRRCSADAGSCREVRRGAPVRSAPASRGLRRGSPARRRRRRSRAGTRAGSARGREVARSGLGSTRSRAREGSRVRVRFRVGVGVGVGLGLGSGLGLGLGSGLGLGALACLRALNSSASVPNCPAHSWRLASSELPCSCCGNTHPSKNTGSEPLPRSSHPTCRSESGGRSAEIRRGARSSSSLGGFRRATPRTHARRGEGRPAIGRRCRCRRVRPTHRR